MRIRQPFAKQPIPRFGGGSTWAFIFVIRCRYWPAYRSASHTCCAILPRASGPLRTGIKLGVTMTMQPRSAQPQINVIHRFDASTILKMRIALRSLEEEGALLAHASCHHTDGKDASRQYRSADTLLARSSPWLHRAHTLRLTERHSLRVVGFRKEY